MPLQFLNPHIMVKKGASVPAGHINEWFWEGDARDHLRKKLPKDVAEKMRIGMTKFYRFPENLYQSRKRYIRSFQVGYLSGITLAWLSGSALQQASCKCVDGVAHKSCAR